MFERFNVGEYLRCLPAEREASSVLFSHPVATSWAATGTLSIVALFYSHGISIVHRGGCWYACFWSVMRGSAIHLRLGHPAQWDPGYHHAVIASLMSQSLRCSAICDHPEDRPWSDRCVDCWTPVDDLHAARRCTMASQRHDRI